MRLKEKKENYLLQVGMFVFDYKKDNSTEKIIVAYSEDLSKHSIYTIVNNKPILEYTNMEERMIKSYLDDLKNNFALIVEMGRDII